MCSEDRIERRKGREKRREKKGKTKREMSEERGNRSSRAQRWVKSFLSFNAV